MCKFDKRYQELFRNGVDLYDEDTSHTDTDPGKTAGQEVDMQQSEFE